MYLTIENFNYINKLEPIGTMSLVDVMDKYFNHPDTWADDRISGGVVCIYNNTIHPDGQIGSITILDNHYHIIREYI